MVDAGALERIYNAIDSLVDAIPIKARLENAARTLEPLRARDFPEGRQRELFEQIDAGLTKVAGAPEKGDIRATVQGMDDESAVRLAKEIVQLARLIASEVELEW